MAKRNSQLMMSVLAIVIIALTARLLTFVKTRVIPMMITVLLLSSVIYVTLHFSPF